MKVLHLVWNLIRGGTEGQCARVAMELARRGDTHRVAVFRREGFFLEVVERQCGPVLDVGITSMASWNTLMAIRRMAAWVRRERIDVVHAWDADAAIFGQFIAAWGGAPLITSRRDLGQIYPPHKQWLMRRADRKAAAIVANAQAIVEEFARQGTAREKFTVIGNILDLEETVRLREKEFSRVADLPPGERIVMVARLDPEKDVPTFILAAERVAREVPSASFVVAGDGVEKERLMALAIERGLAKRMVFLGDVREVPAMLRHAAIGVLTPSRNEGLSNTILEYMAAGLPVVATECGGNRELVQPPRGGMIAPAGDHDQLARHLIALLWHPEQGRAMGEHNHQRIAAEFQPGMIGDRFAGLYQQVMAG